MALSPEAVVQEEDQQLRLWARNPAQALFVLRLHKLSKSHETVKAERIRSEQSQQALYHQGRIDGIAEVLRLVESFVHPATVPDQPPY